MADRSGWDQTEGETEAIRVAREVLEAAGLKGPRAVVALARSMGVAESIEYSNPYSGGWSDWMLRMIEHSTRGSRG